MQTGARVLAPVILAPRDAMVKFWHEKSLCHLGEWFGRRIRVKISGRGLRDCKIAEREEKMVDSKGWFLSRAPSGIRPWIYQKEKILSSMILPEGKVGYLDFNSICAQSSEKKDDLWEKDLGAPRKRWDK